jgi:hypothetical protein
MPTAGSETNELARRPISDRRVMSVVKDPLRGIVKVVELPVPHREDEQEREDATQDQGQGNEEEDRIHA